MACDSTPSLMFHNNHDGTFTEQALEMGVALSDDGMVQAGMGLGVGDIRVDGNLHIVKTHFAGDTPAVYFNDGKGNFRDATLPLRPGGGNAVRQRGAWVSRTWTMTATPDIFCGDRRNLSGGARRTTNYDPAVVFRNLGKGHFEELLEQAGPGVSALHSSRGCAFGDFDNDGDMDILIVNQNEPPSLLRNDVIGAQSLAQGQAYGRASRIAAPSARG